MASTLLIQKDLFHYGSMCTGVCLRGLDALCMYVSGLLAGMMAESPIKERLIGRRRILCHTFLDDLMSSVYISCGVVIQRTEELNVVYLADSYRNVNTSKDGKKCSEIERVCCPQRTFCEQSHTP